MDVVFSIGLLFMIGRVYAGVPPEICFQEFKWQDCGMPPKPVVYYYKSGSRCEIGMWRGCSPNLNMFVDEYECVQTCIFSVRVRPDDYHKFQENMIDSIEEIATELITTDVTENAENSTATGEVTGKTGETGATGATGANEATGATGATGANEASGATGESGATNADGGVTAGGDGAATAGGDTAASNAETTAGGGGDASTAGGETTEAPAAKK